MKKILTVLSVCFLLSGCLSYEEYSFKFNYATGETEKIYHNFKTAQGDQQGNYSPREDWNLLKSQIKEEFKNKYDADVIKPVKAELFQENNWLSGKEILKVQSPKAFPSVETILSWLHKDEQTPADFDFKTINGDIFLFLPKNKPVRSANGKIIATEGNNIIVWPGNQTVYEFSVKSGCYGTTLLPFYLEEQKSSAPNE